MRVCSRRSVGSSEGEQRCVSVSVLINNEYRYSFLDNYYSLTSCGSAHRSEYKFMKTNGG